MITSDLVNCLFISNSARLVSVKLCIIYQFEHNKGRCFGMRRLHQYWMQCAFQGMKAHTYIFDQTLLNV